MEDNELRQMLSLMETYKERIEGMERQVNIIRGSLEEVNMASQSIKAIIEAKEDDEIVIPIGASSFATFKASSNKNIIVGVGSKISVEKSPEDAAKYMEANAAELTEALKKSVTALQELQQALDTVTGAIQQEYSNRQIAKTSQ